jgi:hypothetical protein
MLEHCKFCGQRIYKTRRYCGHCGAPIDPSIYKGRRTIDDLSINPSLYGGKQIVDNVSVNINVMPLSSNTPAGHWELCSACRGNNYITCHNCGGQRETYNNNNVETCRVCNGQGQLKCPHCTNGQVWVNTEPLA